MVELVIGRGITKGHLKFSLSRDEIEFFWFVCRKFQAA